MKNIAHPPHANLPLSSFKVHTGYYPDIGGNDNKNI